MPTKATADSLRVQSNTELATRRLSGEEAEVHTGAPLANSNMELATRRLSSEEAGMNTGAPLANSFFAWDPSPWNDGQLCESSN